MDATRSIPPRFRAVSWFRLAIAAVLIMVLGPAAPARPALVIAQGESRPSYQINATIQPAGAVVDVQQLVSFTNWTGQPLASVVFRLPPADIAGASIHRAEIANQAGPAQISGAIIEIPVQPEIPVGARVEVALDYAINLPRAPSRLSISSRAVNLGNWYASLSTHRGDWDRRPYTEVGDAFFTEVADFKIGVETGQPMELASTGSLTRRDATHWEIEAQNVRDVAIVGSAEFNIAKTSVGNTTIVAYTLATPADRLAASAAEYIEWFSARFGTYPYSEFRAVETDLPASYGGMEYPGLIMVSSQSGPLNRGSSYDSLIAHEIAHQWFYSIVGNDQIDDSWLDEGFATLAPALFYLDVAPSVGRTQLRQIESGRVVTPLDTPLYAFPDDGPYFTAIYRPGARLLNELRETLGAEAFDQAIRDYVALYAHRIATPRAFLDLLQGRTTVNLNPIVSRFLKYGAFSYAEPQTWRLSVPGTTLSGTADISVVADFAISRLDVWLDAQLVAAQDVAGASSATARLNFGSAPPGEGVLLTRVWNVEGAQFERAIRVTVQ